MKNWRYFVHLILPVLLFGSLSGAGTGVLISLYKFCAAKVLALSAEMYAWLRLHPMGILAVLPVLALSAWIMATVYRRYPNLRGGGIPTSVAALRGLQPVRWFCDIVGVFFLSLSTFFFGVPLGNEGPSVQMGTAVGDGWVRMMPRRFRAWSRYSMTAGSCAGFTAATGSPISGIMFALEDAHGRISPVIILTSFVAVVFSHLTVSLLAVPLGFEPHLFSVTDLPVLAFSQMWLPLLIGLVLGFFAVVFLKLYELIHRFWNRTLGTVPVWVRLCCIFLLTVLLGLCREEFISTGHHLIAHLLHENLPWMLLLVILLLRTVMTLSANTVGMTGGLFLPIMALGAVLSSAAAQLLPFFGEEYRELILVLGISACIAGMMKTPITAVAFSVEALGCGENILPVIIASAVSFAVTEVFRVESITENVLENRVHSMRKGRTARVVETDVTVAPGAFVAGKQIRDVFWPNNLFIFSVKHTDDRDATVAEHDDKAIRAGDVLHIRYSTYDEERTLEELHALVDGE